MKKLIMIVVTLSLALAIIIAPSVPRTRTVDGGLGMIETEAENVQTEYLA